jgi:hypothetical protein
MLSLGSGDSSRADIAVGQATVEKRYCCEHSARCSVHQTPFDGDYVACSCSVGRGSIRHERAVRIHPFVTPSASPEQLSFVAMRALIALEGGDGQLARQLLGDLLGRAPSSAPPNPPRSKPKP